jgi:hypothetical protein
MKDMDLRLFSLSRLWNDQKNIFKNQSVGVIIFFDLSQQSKKTIKYKAWTLDFGRGTEIKHGRSILELGSRDLQRVRAQKPVPL